MTIGIYKIVNNINGKLYIGSSNNIEKRLKYHNSLLKHNKHYNKHLQSSFNINPDNFTFNILQICDMDNLLLQEKYFIDQFSTLNPDHGFNKAPNPNSGTRGLKWSCESKQKLSKTLIENYSQGKRIRINHKHSNETKKAISKANTGRKSCNRKAIWCHQSATEYESIHCAAKNLNLSISGIMDVLSNNLKSIRGYTFEYADKSSKQIRPVVFKNVPVICLETGVIYESRSAAANAIGVKGGDIGRAIKNKKKIKGFTFNEKGQNRE